MPITQTTAGYFNQGDEQAPRLAYTLNMLSISNAGKTARAEPHYKLLGLSPASIRQIQADGFTAIQSHLLLPTRIKAFQDKQLLCTKAAMVTIDQLRRQLPRWQQQGYACATIILGNGEETFDDALSQAHQVVALSRRYQFPIYIELHRASITQDISRTLALITACPALRFNADFSHYIAAYRLCDLKNKQLNALLTQMTPIFQRVTFCHVRYANSHYSQLTQADTHTQAVYLRLMDQVFQHFKTQANKGDMLFIAPELLPPFTGYGQLTRSAQGHQETQSRYQHSLQLIQTLNQLYLEGLPEQGSQPISDSDRPWLDIPSLAELKTLDLTGYSKDQNLRIRLGNALLSETDKQALLSAFIELQTQEPRLLLETARNTVCHSPSATQALINSYPQLRLSLNASEWILGQEITVGKLPSLYRTIKSLKPYIAQTVAEYATAEYRYEPIRYRLTALRQPSVLIEILYNQFYHWLTK